MRTPIARRYGFEIPWEDRFLLAIGKPHPAVQDRLAARNLLLNPGFSWTDVLRVAATHRLQAILAYNLQQDPRCWALVPTAVRDTLRGFQVAVAMRRMLYHQSVSPLLDRLAAERIAVVLMKGAAITETLYPPGTRVLNDFDILIDRSHYAKVADIIAAQGFGRVCRDGRTQASELASYHQIGFTKTIGDHPLMIDLHWLLYPVNRSFCRIDTPSLMSRARAIRYGASSVLVLSPEDMLVHYGSQLVNDTFRWDYQRLADLYALACSSPSWEATVAIATRAGAAGSTHLGLSFASLLGAPVPVSVLEQLQHACRGCALVSRRLATPSFLFRGPVLRYAEEHLLACLLYSGVSNRIGYLGSALGAAWHDRRRSVGVVRSCYLALRALALAARTAGLLASTACGRRVTADRSDVEA